MKRIYYILCTAVALLGGCQKQELSLDATTSSDELTFNTSIDGVPNAQSRAAGTDTDLATTGFYLAGYHTEGKIDATHATAHPNVFDKEVVDQQVAVPLVKYENSKFTLKTIKWLLDDVSYLSFFGWSQSKPFATTVDASTTGIIGQTYDSNDKGYPWIDIRNADAPLDQTDVVGSRSIDHKNDAVLSAVDLDFHHLLSKLSFKAKSSSKANITITAVNIKYAANKVRKKGRYTFGSDVSVIGSYSLDATEFQAGTAPLGSSYTPITAGAEVALGSVLLVPQALAAGDVSIELKYKLSPNSGTIAGAEQTKTLPLSTFTFEQGNNYAYSIDIKATDILVLSNPVIEAWDVLATPLPLIPGPRGDTQLWLDGYDKPYTHTNGKKYWLDRSGYNRHVELTNYYVGYDSGNRYYSFNGKEFNNNQHGGIFQEIPVFQNISAEIVMEGDPNVQSSNQPLVMSGAFVNDMEPRNFLVEMGFNKSTQIALFRNIDNYVMFNDAATLPYNDIIKRHYWLFNSTPNLLQIYLDGGLREEKAVNNVQVNAFKKNVIANGMTGKIFSIKVMSTTPGIVDIVSKYNNARVRFNIPINTKYLPPVTDGLVFCFDGRSGVKTVGSKKYWEDQVGKNDAEIIGTVPYSNNHFTVPGGNKTNYMKMIYNVAMSNDFTAVIVLKPNQNVSEGQPVFWATSEASFNDRMLAIHFPYPGNTIYVDSPGLDRYSFAWPSSVGAVQTLRQIAIRRQKTKNISEFFMSNDTQGSGNASADISQKVCSVMDFGGHNWEGEIYAVRLYNRALTDAEMTQNYNFDKTTFGFTD